MTQNNLGQLALPISATWRQRREPAKAIACYEAALRVRREDTLPQEWAMTQNNLGTPIRSCHLATEARTC